MIDSLDNARHQFIACEWQYDVLPENLLGYSSVTQSLQRHAKEKAEAGLEEQAKILELLARAASMMLAPSSVNEPFTPFFQDFQARKRSATPEDLTVDDLAFFEVILDDIVEPWLTARLADLLWLCKKPKSPEHARIAIESYIAHSIDPDTWHRDIKDCWERAARLCIQIKDFERLNNIKNQLFGAFGIEYPSSKFMALWIAGLLDKLRIDREFREDIADELMRSGAELKREGDFNSARSYLDLAAIKYQQCRDERGWLDCLVSIADCFEKEGDSRSGGSNMVSNSFYENAIQAYRRIPTKNRENYDVNSKIGVIRTKITDSGKASLDEMGLVKTSGVDISDMVKSSIAHVTGKNTLEEALMYFTGLYSAPTYQSLADSAKENMKHSLLGSLIGSRHMSGDGRVIAKTPPMNLNASEDDPANQAVLHRQIQQQFSIEIQLAVEGRILPALRQLIMEHRVTNDFMKALCHHSSIVPQNRVQLMAYALSLGFEHDFGNAIHLLCPQLEHIVRVQLKEVGAHTSNIDREGIENENGLSTLMDLPDAIHIFGEDLVFEIKSVFTDALAFNLRNEVAHGLLDDNSSSSISTIYAWWMILRLVARSIRIGNIQQSKEDSIGKQPSE
ncbi:MAG: DUF4209 domain-containing protein [Idiomarina sp.]